MKSQKRREMAILATAGLLACSCMFSMFWVIHTRAENERLRVRYFDLQYSHRQAQDFYENARNRAHQLSRENEALRKRIKKEK